METQETLHNFLPRHIRKLIQYKEKTPQPLHPQKEGFLDMESTATAYQSIGTSDDYHQYPDPNASKLCQQLAEQYQLDANQICIGNGSTELVDLMIRTFCVPNQHKILTFSPVANRLYHLAKLNAIDVEALPLEPDMQLPLLSEENYAAPNRIIFVENPNSIIGNAVSHFDIADMLGKFDGIVVVDESAIDYSPENSLVSLVKECPNLVVIQSFSGAWGLAGLRVGVAFAQPEIIKVLNIIKPPFSANTVGQQIATQALYVAEKKEKVIEKTIKQREQLKASLEKFPIVKKVHNSTTNTLLVEVEDAKGLVEFLQKEEFIAVLDVSHQVGTENCVRITVRQGLENVRLLTAIKDMKYTQSKTRQFMKIFSTGLRKASSFLGIFRKVMGA